MMRSIFPALLGVLGAFAVQIFSREGSPFEGEAISTVREKSPQPPNRRRSSRNSSTFSSGVAHEVTRRTAEKPGRTLAHT